MKSGFKYAIFLSVYFIVLNTCVCAMETKYESEDEEGPAVESVRVNASYGPSVSGEDRIYVQAVGEEYLSFGRSFGDRLRQKLKEERPEREKWLRECRKASREERDKEIEKLRHGITLMYKPECCCGDETLEHKTLERTFQVIGNPLKKEIDLSECGESSKYIRIFLGFPTEKDAEDSEKLEIWITPRAWVPLHHERTLTRFRSIMAEWDIENPLALFWRGRSRVLAGHFLKGYRYLITQRVGKLLDGKDLYIKWLESKMDPLYTEPQTDSSRFQRSIPIPVMVWLQKFSLKLAIG